MQEKYGKIVYEFFVNVCMSFTVISFVFCFNQLGIQLLLLIAFTITVAYLLADTIQPDSKSFPTIIMIIGYEVFIAFCYAIILAALFNNSIELLNCTNFLCFCFLVTMFLCTIENFVFETE